MRHILALSVLLALAVPLTLRGQPTPASPTAAEKEPDWLDGAVNDLVRDRPDALAAAKARIVGWLNDAKVKTEDLRFARIHMVLVKMTDAKVAADRRSEIAAAVADAIASDRTVAADVRVARIKELFKEMATKSPGPFKDAEAERVAMSLRTAARDVLVAMVTGPGKTSVEIPGAVSDIVGEYLAGKDPVTLVDAAMIVAKSRSMLLVPTMVKGLDSPAPAVRYWSAKGLADAQGGIYELAETGMNGVAQFTAQMKALSDRFAREDSPPVMMELFRALGATDPAKMTDARRNQIVYKEFGAVFRKRLDLLDQGNLANLDVDVAGLASAATWEQAFRSTRAMRAAALGDVCQMLWWAFDIYSNQKDSLSEGQKAGLEHVMLKAADVIGGSLTEPDFKAIGIDPSQKQELLMTIKRELEAGNVPNAGLKILEWVGQPGEECLMNRIGVASAQKRHGPAPTSAPAGPGN